jgi:hypothetical protein
MFPISTALGRACERYQGRVARGILSDLKPSDPNPAAGGKRRISTEEGFE